MYLFCINQLVTKTKDRKISLTSCIYIQFHIWNIPLKIACQVPYEKVYFWYSRSELGIHKSKVLQIYEIYIADWTQIKLIALFREGIIYDGLILVRALLHKWFKLFSLYSVASQRNIFTTFIRYITNSLLRAAFVDSRLRV